MQNLKSFTLNKLQQSLATINEPEYRALQILKWLWIEQEYNFENYSNLPLSLRNYLKENFYISQPQIINQQKSKDGTMKVLFKFEDVFVESVLIFEEKRKTICISVQNGCPVKCSFCASGKIKFKRNLKFFEILEQVTAMPKVVETQNLSSSPINNIVFMGIGEPLLNLNELKIALGFLTHKNFFNYSPQKITVSTIGIINNLENLIKDYPKINLALSLHFALQEKREKFIPFAQKNNLKTLKKLLIYLQKKYNLNLTIEYLILPDINTNKKDIKVLKEFLSNLKVKINLIPYNYNVLDKSSNYQKATKTQINNLFLEIKKFNKDTTVRKSKGEDISAGCGQLAANL